MFAERSIVVEPPTTTKLLIGPQNQEFILGQILPAVWEVGSDDHHKNEESFHPSDDVVNFFLQDRLELLVRIMRPAKNSEVLILLERCWLVVSPLNP